MFISYNEACARDCSTLERDLELCEKAGFDYIEIRLDMLGEYLKHHTVEQLQAFFKTSRLKPHAFNALYLYPEFLGENDDEARQKALLEEFRLGCEVGRAIGSHYFIIVPPLQRDPAGGPYMGAWEDTFANCVRILRELSDRAQAYLSQLSVCFVVPKHTKEWSTHGKHSKTRREQLSADSIPWIRLPGESIETGAKDRSPALGPDGETDAEVAERAGGTL